MSNNKKLIYLLFKYHTRNILFIYYNMTLLYCIYYLPYFFGISFLINVSFTLKYLLIYPSYMIIFFIIYLSFINSHFFNRTIFYVQQSNIQKKQIIHRRIIFIKNYLKCQLNNSIKQLYFSKLKTAKSNFLQLVKV